MAAKRHRHKYYLGHLGSSRVWTCALPDCTHYIPVHMQKMANGKNSFCWSCGSEINLNPDNMKDDHPRCLNCRGILVIEEKEEEKEEIKEIPLSSAMKEFLEK